MSHVEIYPVAEGSIRLSAHKVETSLKHILGITIAIVGLAFGAVFLGSRAGRNDVNRSSPLERMEEVVRSVGKMSVAGR